MSNCVFCEILHETEPAQAVANGLATLGIVPLNPVTEGHVIFIPRKHVRDAATEPDVTAKVMEDASHYVQIRSRNFALGGLYESVNLITSVGRPATQSVFHLHIHVVPRKENDGLALPLYSGKTRKGRADDH